MGLSELEVGRLIRIHYLGVRRVPGGSSRSVTCARSREDEHVVGVNALVRTSSNRSRLQFAIKVWLASAAANGKRYACTWVGKPSYPERTRMKTGRSCEGKSDQSHGSIRRTASAWLRTVPCELRRRWTSARAPTSWGRSVAVSCLSPGRNPLKRRTRDPGNERPLRYECRGQLVTFQSPSGTIHATGYTIRLKNPGSADRLRWFELCSSRARLPASGRP